MKCPFCGHLETQVVETRVSEDASFIRRRRQCNACEKRFTTYERADVTLPAVAKKDGSRADFNIKKVRASMMLALRKRPVSIEQIDSALLRIEQELLSSGMREIASTQVGELVMRELEDMDKVAYIRFASVYRSFTNVDEFRQLLQDI
ncbi:transcriptional repressor NrdR [Polaromonas sp.]|nr:transcriptional repressor NrdR [Polaromonas sp.]